MKKFALLAAVCFVLVHFAAADEITFSYIIGAPGSVTASPTGFASGPSMNITVSDSTTGQDFPLGGTFTDSAGPASSFHVTPTQAIATYTAGGANSVLIVDSLGHSLVAGSMAADGAFLTALPDGAGAYLGSFDVSFVSPAVLALFGLGPNFNPKGSVSETFAHDTFNGTDIVGQLGGGTVTITTPTAVPEPKGLGLAGIGFLTLARAFRRYVHSA